MVRLESSSETHCFQPRLKVVDLIAEIRYFSDRSVYFIELRCRTAIFDVERQPSRRYSEYDMERRQSGGSGSLAPASNINS